MKKIGYIMSAGLLALSSCTNEIFEEGFIDKANSISFNAYSNKTRAEGDSYVSGDVNIEMMKKGSFGVVGYKSGGDLYLGSTSKAIEQWYNQSSGTWEYKNKNEMKYWPSGTMNFYAYFPYSSTGDVFAASDASGDVMTITNESGNQDVLFARTAGISQTDRVPLYFKHAFAKIASVNIEVNAVDVEVKVSKVEILNTSTKGQVKVDNSGNASYEVTDNDAIRSFDLSPAVTINYGATNGIDLFGNSANGYLFATNSNVEHNVKGTGKTLWNGSKDALNSGTLSASNLVCLKLTCTVKAKEHYLVGDANADGVMYIPMRGTSTNSADISALLAGRRYTYKIIMTSNVGYKDNGDPIMLSPILFSVNEVAKWDDVTVTINL